MLILLFPPPILLLPPPPPPLFHPVSFTSSLPPQLHVHMADKAVRVGPAAATESYLDMEAIFRAIDKTGAQVIC